MSIHRTAHPNRTHPWYPRLSTSASSQLILGHPRPKSCLIPEHYTMTLPIPRPFTSTHCSLHPLSLDLTSWNSLSRRSHPPILAFSSCLSTSYHDTLYPLSITSTLSCLHLLSLSVTAIATHRHSFLYGIYPPDLTLVTISDSLYSSAAHFFITHVSPSSVNIHPQLLPV
jgi:hypothetical protein